MKRSDITDLQVVQAALALHAKPPAREAPFIDARLMQCTGAPIKVVYAAMNRAEERGLIECGVSLRTAWPTDEGYILIASQGTTKPPTQPCIDCGHLAMLIAGDAVGKTFLVCAYCGASYKAEDSSK